MKRAAALIAATLGLLCAAAPASADSIAYIKEHNIWLAAPDGSHQVQITRDGTATAPYRSPSQADDGTLAAAHGSELVKLAQSGQPLGHFAPPTATDSTGQTVQDVPQQVAISPDGRLLAYVYSQPSCPPAAPCGVRQEMLYSYSDHTTPVSVFGEQTNLTHPSWIDNGRLLAFGGHFHQVNVDAPGGGNDDAAYWFDDPGNEDIGDGELSRQGDRLALVRSYGPDTHLAILHVTGAPGAATPVAACYSGKDGALAGPSWSPDGTQLAFADSSGIEVLPLPQVIDGDCPGAGSSRVIVTGATEPDWGPASISANAGTWRPAQPPPPPPPPAVKPRLTASLPRAFSLATAARSGVTLRVSSSVAGRVSVTVAAGARTTVTRASGSLRAGVAAVLRLRATAGMARTLRRRHVTRLTVTISLTAAGSRARAVRTATLRVTR